MEEKLTKDEKKELRQKQWQNDLEKERKKKLLTTLSLWGFGALLVVLAIVGLVAFSSSSNTQSNSSVAMPKITNADYTSGPTNAKATLTEYADFQCPACKAYYPVLKQLQKDYSGKVLFVYRFFPLSSIHRNAYASAKAAYAAGLQGKFWDMHDKLFETQDSWAELPDPTSTFASYAKTIGLDVVQFTKDQASSNAQTVVADSYNSAINLGLSGTPTFFLNGKLIENPTSYDGFKKIIDSALTGK